MLRRGRTGEGETSRPLDVPSLDPKSPASASWKLPGDLGRRYGAVSGDRNPIHMYALTAKPLGFNSAIAHGMWTKARALAQVGSRIPDSFRADVRFRKPVYLPGKVDFASSGDGDGFLFNVRDSRKATPHLDGRISALAPSTSKAKI